VPEPVATDLYTLEDAEDHIGDLRGKVDRLGEIVSLDQTDVTPNTVTNQLQLYSDAASGLLSIVSDSGAQGDIPWTRQAFFPGNAVTGTSLANLASGTYPANDAVGGAIYEVSTWGSGTQAATTRRTLQFEVQFGGQSTSTQTFGATSFSAPSVGFRWIAVARVICVTTGASGTWQTSIMAMVTDNTGAVSPTNNNMGLLFNCDAAGTYTVDTTVDETIAIRAAWESTTGSPTMTSRVAFQRRIC